MNVVHTLQEAGYEAYIVGGAVRDLLLGLRPKDFDVATNATPEQVKSLFRRAFIIGRRFRIVHVVYGRGREHEVIEVSTFRAHMDNAWPSRWRQRAHQQERTGRHEARRGRLSGRVLRDNVWGPQEEDAARRDFTINAMYYDPEPGRGRLSQRHQGREEKDHAHDRRPGHALPRRPGAHHPRRALRGQAQRAGLQVRSQDRRRRCVEMSKLLADVPQSRLFDEMLKLLQTGHAHGHHRAAQLKLGLARGIYPLLDVVVERADQPFVKAALQDTDRRVGEGKPVAPSFLLACVLWADVRDGWAQRQAAAAPPFPALQDAIDDVFNSPHRRRVGPRQAGRRHARDLDDAAALRKAHRQHALQPGRAAALSRRLRLHAPARRATGEVDVVLADWWQEFSTAATTA
jgi:poly(A) polymerase